MTSYLICRKKLLQSVNKFTGQVVIIKLVSATDAATTNCLH